MTRFMFAALAALALVWAPASAPRAAAAAPPAHGNFKNFKVAVYVVVGNTRRLADPKVFAEEFDRIHRQVPFDKVYVEVYRDRNFATDAELSSVIKAFRARGIEVDGGVTLAAGGHAGQFGTFDYENPSDMAECRKAVEIAARHFDHFVLDDFFFYTSKSDLDIKAKGDRSWTQYRLDTMRRASQDCVLGPARRVNPKVKVTIKYPNWYEHFHALGYDLEKQPYMFDSIYTGTETRDPFVTDQLLQQYEGYNIYRYFSNIRPGANLGGWVDPFDTTYADRYAEQLWLTMFAKSPEITLFSWGNIGRDEAFAAGTRPWADRPTSFDIGGLMRDYKAGGAKGVGPSWAEAAGYALKRVDPVIGALGKPIGIASYRPPHAVGEDFLHNYLGNIGIPIELYPTFPAQGPVLLTEAAATDPDIVAKMKGALAQGRNLVITSGLLGALQSRGFDDIAELDVTGRVAAIDRFIDGFGAGAGKSLNSASGQDAKIVFPEVRFMTNDTWPIIRGVAGAKGFPIMMLNRYSKGILYVLTIPDNAADLYALPQPLLSKIRDYVVGDFPVKLDAPALVSVFAYDNGTFVVESFREGPADIGVSVAGAGGKLRDLATGEIIAAAPAQTPRSNADESAPRVRFPLHLEPHSFRAFKIER